MEPGTIVRVKDSYFSPSYHGLVGIVKSYKDIDDERKEVRLEFYNGKTAWIDFEDLEVDDFRQRFVDLYHEGQIELNCDDAKKLLDDAMIGLYQYGTVDMLSGNFPVTYEDEGDEFLGILFWKEGEDCTDAVFIYHEDGYTCYKTVHPETWFQEISWKEYLKKCGSSIPS